MVEVKPCYNPSVNTYIEQTFTIPERCAGMRVDQATHSLLADYSRMYIIRWIKQGAITIDGQQIRPSYKVHAGEHIHVAVTLETEIPWSAQEIALDIVYEDDELLVVNKPPGLVVHPGAGNPDATLVNALLHHASQLEQLPRAGLIHRLDKDTSGLLAIAKTLSTHNYLVSALQARKIQRQYIALVNGLVTASGTVDAPIGRHPRTRIKMAVVTNGKPAITHYRLQEKYHAHTLLSIQLDTGRTHQIRVHMAHIHHPIVGDPLYEGRKIIPAGVSQAARTAIQQMNRQALHACQLDFIHPTSQKHLCFKADIPKDMQTLIIGVRPDPC